ASATHLHDLLAVRVASSGRWWTVIVIAAASTTADRNPASFPVLGICNSSKSLIDQLDGPARAFLWCQLGFVRRRYGVFLTVRVSPPIRTPVLQPKNAGGNVRWAATITNRSPIEAVGNLPVGKVMSCFFGGQKFRMRRFPIVDGRFGHIERTRQVGVPCAQQAELLDDGGIFGLIARRTTSRHQRARAS